MATSRVIVVAVAGEYVGWAGVDLDRVRKHPREKHAPRG